jgi:hypothetical protein
MKEGKDYIYDILTGMVKCDYNIEVVLDEGEIGEILNEAGHFD